VSNSESIFFRSERPYSRHSCTSRVPFAVEKSRSFFRRRSLSVFCSKGNVSSKHLCSKIFQQPRNSISKTNFVFILLSPCVTFVNYNFSVLYHFSFIEFTLFSSILCYFVKAAKIFNPFTQNSSFLFWNRNFCIKVFQFNLKPQFLPSNFFSPLTLTFSVYRC